MPNVNFPKRNNDGSFCIEVSLRLVSDSRGDLGSRIQRWIDNEWMVEHSTWKRVWRTGPNLETIDEEILNYTDEFIKAPQISACEASEIQFQLFGKKSAKFWKDWLVSRFLPDLKAEFPEIDEGISIENCRE